MSKITDFEDMYLQCMTRPIFSATLLVHYNNSTCLRSSLVTVIITSTTWTTLAAHSTEITMVPREIYNASLLHACMDHIFWWCETYTSCVIYCSFAMCGIVRHRVATHVKATKGTRLGKYLTMPYFKNAMK